MKTLPAGLADHVLSGATSLCWCWKLRRNDGLALGFTDHDRQISFDGLAYEPASGFEGTEMETSAGLNVDNLDVLGALDSAHLNEADLAAGLFDNAEVEIWLVNWRDVEERVLLRKGNLGEVTRAEKAFTAEIRGLAHKLNQPRGRVFQYGCDTDVGSARCRVDLEAATFKGAGTVTAVTDNRVFYASGLEGFAAGWFNLGSLHWTTGANAGRGMEIKTHALEGVSAAIGLWQSMSETIMPGDQFTIRAGCDKQFATCRDKFANGLNFQGFPQMPGNDFVLSYPRRSDGDNDGGSLL